MADSIEVMRQALAALECTAIWCEGSEAHPRVLATIATLRAALQAPQEQATNAPRSSSEPVAPTDEKPEAGWRLVPVQATSEMGFAGQQYASETLDRPKGAWWWRRLCEAMIAAAPPALSPPDNEAKLVCFEAYQVVGSLLLDLDKTEAPEAEKILDNLSQARLVHRDVLPWPSYAQPEAGSRLDAERLDWLEQRLVDVREHRRYGSQVVFTANSEHDEENGITPSNLRAAIDAALAAEGEKKP